MSPELVSSPRILLAESDPGVLRAIETLLIGKNACVVAVDNGADAVREASKSVFDLCILEMEMPAYGMNGIAVCERLRAMPHTARLPVLFLTKSEDMAAISRAFDAGASDFLVKPVIENLLWHRITILLHIAELSREVQGLKDAMSFVDRQ